MPADPWPSACWHPCPAAAALGSLSSKLRLPLAEAAASETVLRPPPGEAVGADGGDLQLMPKLLRDLRRLSWLDTSSCRAALSTAATCAADEQMGRRNVGGPHGQCCLQRGCQGCDGGSVKARDSSIRLLS